LRESEAYRLAEIEALTPFNLAQPPMLRARLLRLEEQDHILLLTMHHIASDGWSAGVLVPEAVNLYEAFRQGQPSPLPELEIQYADYAAWQRQWLQGDVLEKQLDYWRSQLAEIAPLQLPTDHPRPAAPTRASGNQEIIFSAELTGKLQELGR